MIPFLSWDKEREIKQKKMGKIWKCLIKKKYNRGEKFQIQNLLFVLYFNHILFIYLRFVFNLILAKHLYFDSLLLCFYFLTCLSYFSRIFRRTWGPLISATRIDVECLIQGANLPTVSFNSIK